MKKILTAAIVLFGIVAFSMPANAEFVKDEDPGGLPLFLVKADDSSSFKGDVGSQTSGVIVNITTDVNVDTGNGEANIKPSELNLTKLTFTPANGTLFGDFSFGGALVDGGTITVKVWDNRGSPFAFTFNTDASGNFGIFGIVAEQGSGETIQKVEISSSGFKQVKQIDFSYALVPEPITMILLGLGLLGLGIAVWKRY